MLATDFSPAFCPENKQQFLFPFKVSMNHFARKSVVRFTYMVHHYIGVFEKGHINTCTVVETFNYRE